LRAPRQSEARKSFRYAKTMTTTCAAGTKATSIGKSRNAVWIDQPGRKTIPSPGLSSRRPSSPRRRRNAVSATKQRSHTTLPSSSRRRTSAPGGPAISGRPEDLADRVEGRAEQDDEHGWEDEEDQREEN